VATPFNNTLERNIGANCATSLDEADDNNTGSDFALSTNDPRNNSQAPTETLCPPTGGGGTAPTTSIDKEPKNKVKTKKKKVKVSYSFSSDAVGASFQCKLDKASLAPCASPFTAKVKKGKHEFTVQATNGGLTDQSPAIDDFKVKRKK